MGSFLLPPFAQNWCPLPHQCIPPLQLAPGGDRGTLHVHPLHHGSHGHEHPLRLVSVEQGHHRKLLVRDSVQGDVSSLGALWLQYDNRRRRSDVACRHSHWSHVLLPHVQIPPGLRGPFPALYPWDSLPVVPKQERGQHWIWPGTCKCSAWWWWWWTGGWTTRRRWSIP